MMLLPSYYSDWTDRARGMMRCTNSSNGGVVKNLIRIYMKRLEDSAVVTEGISDAIRDVIEAVDVLSEAVLRPENYVDYRNKVEEARDVGRARIMHLERLLANVAPVFRPSVLV